MKIRGHEFEVTLLVHGRERTFSEKELISILEKYFQNEVTEQLKADVTEKAVSSTDRAC